MEEAEAAEAGFLPEAEATMRLQLAKPSHSPRALHDPFALQRTAAQLHCCSSLVNPTVLPQHVKAT